MQARCQNCHKPFALSKETVHEALDAMATEGQDHFFLMACPHCRKNTRIPRLDLTRAAPDWKPAADKN